jgi:ZIP family zinc transporter
MFLLDVTIPHIRFGEEEIPHSAEPLSIQSHIHAGARSRRHGRRRLGRLIHAAPAEQTLLRSGLLIAIGITIHNIPEGIAVGAGYLHAPAYGFFIAMAILLHNLPEGIAIALPLRASGVSRWDSFKAAFLSGMAEPLGAFFAAVFLTAFQGLIPAALAFAGGVMNTITLDELAPAAREYGHHHATALGIITGAIFVFLLSGVMAV